MCPDVHAIKRQVPQQRFLRLVIMPYKRISDHAGDKVLSSGERGWQIAVGPLCGQ